MKNKSLITKVLFIALSGGALLFLLIGINIYESYRAKEILTLDLRTQTLSAFQLSALIGRSKDFTRQVIRFIVTSPNDQEEWKKLTTNNQKTEKEIQDLLIAQKTNLSPELTKAIEETLQVGGAVVRHISSGNRPQALDLANKSFRATYEALFAQGRLEMEKQESQAKASLEAVASVLWWGIFLTISLSLSGLFLILSFSFLSAQKIQGTILSRIRHILELSSFMNVSFETLSFSSERISNATSQQSAAVQETVASVEQIRSMVARNAEHAETSGKKADAIMEILASSKTELSHLMNTVAQLVAGTEKIQKQIQSSNTELNDVVTVIHEINKKTEVINDIVFQTKLLSFNASVEAARAGEHGKGFAVVAQEVGALAQLSGTAAHDISQILLQNVERVESVIHHSQRSLTSIMEENQKVVTNVETQLNSWGEAFDHTIQEVKGMHNLMSEMSQASKEQSIGVDQITSAVHEINRGLQANLVASQDLNQSATEYAGEIQNLIHNTVDVGWEIRGADSKKKRPPDTEKTIDAAIRAHASWKEKLFKIMRMVEEKNGQLATIPNLPDPKVVTTDNQCDLGKWIYSLGEEQFGHTKTFAELKILHAEFHKEASNVLRLALSGDPRVKAALAKDSSFLNISSQVINHLLDLKFS